MADKVARTVEQSLAQAERLRRQSILKRAFEGRLVAQDAGDEPAGGAAGEDTTGGGADRGKAKILISKTANLCEQIRTRRHEFVLSWS